MTIDYEDLHKQLPTEKDEHKNTRAVSELHSQNSAEFNAPIPTGDSIDGPEHYNGYQVIDTIWDAGYGEGFCLGNAMKYISRAKKKNNALEDIKKAKWYLAYWLRRSKETV